MIVRPCLLRLLFKNVNYSKLILDIIKAVIMGQAMLDWTANADIKTEETHLFPAF